MNQQNVRLMDVFVLGPLMVYVGWNAKGVDRFLANSLAAFGALTILYNGQNYLRVQGGQEAL